jgi:mono/diheme cytochrome c family protein
VSRSRFKGLLRPAALGGLALLLLIQLVPYGRSHDNPPVTRAAAWGPGPAEELASQSCNDCHSNLTKWRWYSNIAPASWLVQNDVDGGRSRLNFSEWDSAQPDLSEVADKVTSGEMPPWQYTLAHPSASLSAKEKQQLADGLKKLYETDPPGTGG